MPVYVCRSNLEEQGNREKSGAGWWNLQSSESWVINQLNLYLLGLPDRTSKQLLGSPPSLFYPSAISPSLCEASLCVSSAPKEQMLPLVRTQLFLSHGRRMSGRTNHILTLVGSSVSIHGCPTRRFLNTPSFLSSAFFLFPKEDREHEGSREEEESP